MKNFYAEYAVYKGITYLRKDYYNEIALYDINDYEYKNLLFKVPVELIKEKYNIINKAVLNGLEYVYYEIENGIVTYSTTHKNKEYRHEKLEKFDLVYQQIFYYGSKKTQTNIIYINNEKISADCVNRIRPEEMANGGIMLCMNSDIISLNDVYEAIETLYQGRLSEKGEIEGDFNMDEFITWINIDDVKINIDQDLTWDLTTVYCDKKGFGEKYIFEIADYFNSKKKCTIID